MRNGFTKGLITGGAIAMLVSGGTAFAAAFVTGHVSFVANGKRVAHQADVKYKGTTYVPVSGVLKTLRAEGLKATWKANTISVVAPKSTSSSITSPKSTTSTSSQNQTPPSTSNGTPIKVTDADYSALQNGTEYQGKTISFGGQVFETPQVQNGQTIAQVDISSDQTGDFVDVILPANASVQKDEFIQVVGRVGNNSNLIFPTVAASSISPTTWGATFYPAIQTFNPNLTQTQNGLTISITKVDIAKGQVRLFLSADNETQANVMIDDSMQDTLTQGSTQFSQHDMYGLGYPDFHATIANGTKSTAVVVFDGNVGSGTLTYTLPASSDNYNQNWNNFVFTIQLPSN